MNSNLCIELNAKGDRNKSIYFLGRVHFPGTIDLRDAVFLIFTSAQGEEVLQVGINNKENAIYSKYSVRSDRLRISLEERIDSFKQKYHIAKLNVDGYIRCNSETVFIVFNSNPSCAELQLVGDIVIEGQREFRDREFDKEIKAEFSEVDDIDYKMFAPAR